MALYNIPNNSSIAVNCLASIMAWGRGRQPTQQPAPHRPAGCRAVPVNFREGPGSGEEFNFTGMDKHSPDGHVPDAPQPVSPISVEPVPGSATSTRPAMPSEQTSEPSQSQMTPDIDFFFECGSKVPPVSRTLCKTCKYVALQSLHMLYWQGLLFRVNRIDLCQGAGSFSVTTSNGVLCNHLLSRHKDVYVEKCYEMRWKVAALESEAPVASGCETNHPPFSQTAFIQHLLNFIVADDQVSKACF